MAKKEPAIGKATNNGKIEKDPVHAAPRVADASNNYGADDFTIPCSRARFSTEAKPYVLDECEPDAGWLSFEN